MLKIFVCSVLLASCAAISLKFTDCGSAGATISAVNVPQCTEDPCIFHHGTNYSINVDMTPTENSATAKTSVHALVGSSGIPVPIPVPSDSCSDRSLNCPIVSGQAQTYTSNIFCSPDYPTMNLQLKWEVVADNQRYLFCIVMPIQIQV